MLEACESLEDCERTLADKSRETVILGLLPLTEDDVNRLGSFLSERIDSDRRETEVLLRNRFPHSLAFFLVGVAAYEYRAGEYWTAVRALCDLPSGQKWQELVGWCFRDYLGNRSLDKFDDGGLAFVAPILAHACIPNYCLPDFFENFLSPIANSQQVIGRLNVTEVISEWLDNSTTQLTTDKPVIRFLTSSAEPIQKLVLDCLRMAKDSLNDESLNRENYPALPDRIFECYIDWLNGDLKIEPQAEFAPRTRRNLPYLRLSPEANEVLLVLPKQRLDAQSVKGPLQLTVRSNFGQSTSQTISSSRNGDFIEVTEQSITIPWGSDLYNIQLSSAVETIYSWLIQGLIDDQEYLIFDGSTCKAISLEAPISPPFWLLCRSAFSLERNGAVHISEQTREFHDGWSGYRALRVASAFREVELQSDDDSFSIPIALSDSESGILVSDTSLVPNVTSQGAPVYSSFPRVKVTRPKSLTGCICHTTARPQSHFESVEKIETFELEQEFATTSRYLRLPISRKWKRTAYTCGSFSLDWKEPGKEAIKSLFVVIPDLSIEFDKDFYPPVAARSTTPITASVHLPNATNITAPHSLRVTKSDGTWLLELPGDISQVQCSLSLPDQDEPIEIELQVPRITTAITNNRKTSCIQWRNDLPHIGIDKLESLQRSYLAVNHNQLDIEYLELTLPHTDQSQRKEKKKKDVAFFDLRQYIDSLRSLKKTITTLQLILKQKDKDPQRFPILNIAWDWYLSDFNVEEERRESNLNLLFTWNETGHRRDRLARIYDISRPWLTPREFTIDDNEQMLLVSTTSSAYPPGLYRFELCIEDPWDSFNTSLLPPDPNDLLVFDYQVGSSAELEEYVNSLEDSTINQLEQYSLAATSSSLGYFPSFELNGIDDEQVVRALVKLTAILINGSPNSTRSAQELWTSTVYLDLPPTVQSWIDDAVGTLGLDRLDQTYLELRKIIYPHASNELHSSFLTGQHVRHQRYGVGIVEDFQDENIKIKFSDGSLYVEPNGLEVCPPVATLGSISGRRRGRRKKRK